MLLSDSEITKSLQHDDERVFEQLFRHYHERLCNYAYLIVKDMEESEEVIQNVFLDIWEKRKSLVFNSSVKAYLYKAVHNSSLNKLKHSKVRRLYAEDFVHHVSPVYNHTEQVLQKNELEKQIHFAINALPEQCRMVFKLSRFEEMKYSEIASHLNISVKTVENHMGKALKLMREHLKDFLTVITLLLPWLLK